MGILEDRLTKGILERCNKTGEMLGKQISLPYPQKLTRSDIEKMVKLKCNRGGHILYYYLQNDINLAIIYDADKNEYIVHAGNTYIHQIKTLEDAKSKLKEIVVNFICSVLGVEG